MQQTAETVTVIAARHATGGREHSYSGVIGMYHPTGMRPGRQKYPTCLSGRVVHIISRPPFVKTSTQYGGPTVIKSRVMFYPNL